MADVTATASPSQTAAAGATAAGTSTAAAPDQGKVTAFQLALQAALQAPPVLSGGGGTDDDDNDDGTSLTIHQGIGFPVP